MVRELISPEPVRPGDRIAVLSPSWAAPAEFPAVHEQAMQRLRDVFDLEPVEFPTTRRVSTPRERAADVNSAFADPSIRAILATIGGDDQIAILKHLDPRLPVADPKLFLGYSDNTNLLNWLWFHRVAGIHGGSTQVHLGPGPSIDEQHRVSLQAALFGGEVTLEPVPRSRDFGISWDDPRALTEQASDEPVEGWRWSGPAKIVSAPTWGGNLEIISWNLAADRWIHPVEEYAGCVLVLETSEERPSALEVYRMLRNMGERG
nr:LD-carboxypeptidase [Propionibacteriales bacterium]